VACTSQAPSCRPDRKLKDSKMIELDMYFYLVLGARINPIANIRANWPIQTTIAFLISARMELGTFEKETDRALAFPRTAEVAMGLCSIIDEITMPLEVNQQYGAPLFSTGQPQMNEHQAQRIRELCQKFYETFQQESQRSYVLKVQDQRIFSAYTLVEKIEDAITPNTWKYLSALTRREIEECGKCLSIERYTACGFHILRGIESVIREYIAAIPGVTLAQNQRNWGEYVRLLKDNNAAHEVTSIVEGLRQDDRNPLMHPEKFLDMHQAVGLFCLCLTALDRLVADMVKRGIAKLFSPVTAPLP
jgi:hypothetical protein